MGYLYVLGTVLMTVYGQLILKWQVVAAGPFPTDTIGKLYFLLRMLANPWVISVWICAFLAALFWMAAMSRYDLSYAYPFVSLTFVLVLLFSGLFLHEPITIYKILGILLIISGVVIGCLG